MKGTSGTVARRSLAALIPSNCGMLKSEGWRVAGIAELASKVFLVWTRMRSHRKTKRASARARRVGRHFRRLPPIDDSEFLAHGSSLTNLPATSNLR